MKPEYRTLLDRIALDELDPSAPEVLAAVRADKGFEASLSELADLQRELSLERESRDQALSAIRDGVSREDVLRTRRALRSSPSFQAARATMHAQTEEQPNSHLRPSRVSIAAAAALIVIVLVVQQVRNKLDEPGPEPGPTMGGAALELLSPSDFHSADAVLEWSGDLGPSERFIVELYALDETSPNDMLIDRAEVLDNRWRPTVDIPAGELRWCVVRTAPGGIVVERACRTTVRRDD